MKHDVHEPFRIIHGCILGTGHDAIHRMSVCIAGIVGFRCRMFGCFRNFGFVSGFRRHRP